MSDKYYSEEEAQEMSSEDQLISLDQSAAHFLQLNEQVQAAQNELNQAASEIYLGAADSSDEETMNRAVTIYNQAAALSEHVVQVGGQLAATVKLAQTLAGEKRRVVEELAGLVEAVENADTNHPLVSELVETVEEWVSENVDMGYFEDTADETAVSELADSNGIEWDVASRLYDAIRQGRFADEMKALAARLPLPETRIGKPYAPPVPSPADVDGDEDYAEDEDWSDDEDDQDYDEVG